VLFLKIGIQENNLNTLQADISLTGYSVINWPYGLINPIGRFFIISAFLDFPVVHGSATFDTESVCTSSGSDFIENEDGMCHQTWDLFFTVDKVCEVDSIYTVYFYMSNYFTNKTLIFPYEVRLSQAAVCGIMVEGAPLDGSLAIVDETYKEEQESSFKEVGDYVYFKLETEGLANITAVKCLWLNLQYRGKTYRIISSEVDEDGNASIDNDWADLFSPLRNTHHEVTWSLRLDPGMFHRVFDWTPLTLIINVEVTYLQGRRLLTTQGGRRRLVVENEVANYDFSHKFGIQPYHCRQHPSESGTRLGQYKAIPCGIGYGEQYVLCTMEGFNYSNIEGSCETQSIREIETVLPPEEEFPLGLLVAVAAMIVILLGCLYRTLCPLYCHGSFCICNRTYCTCKGVCPTLKKMRPEDMMNYKTLRAQGNGAKFVVFSTSKYSRGGSVLQNQLEGAQNQGSRTGNQPHGRVASMHHMSSNGSKKRNSKSGKRESKSGKRDSKSGKRESKSGKRRSSKGSSRRGSRNGSVRKSQPGVQQINEMAQPALGHMNIGAMSAHMVNMNAVPPHMVNANAMPPHMMNVNAMIPATMATNNMLTLHAMNNMGASSMQLHNMGSSSMRLMHANPNGQRHQHGHFPKKPRLFE